MTRRRGRPSFPRRQRPQPGDDVVEIAVGHFGIEAETHRRLELAAVLVDTLRYRTLDLGIGPATQPSGLAGGQVPRDRNAPGALEFTPALAEQAEIMTPAGLRRVTFHAMGDGRKIESVLDLVTEVRLRHLLGRARDVFTRNRFSIHRRRDLVVDRLDALEVGGNAVDIAPGGHLVESR